MYAVFALLAASVMCVVCVFYAKLHGKVMGCCSLLIIRFHAAVHTHVASYRPHLAAEVARAILHFCYTQHAARAVEYQLIFPHCPASACRVQRSAELIGRRGYYDSRAAACLPAATYHLQRL